MITQPGLVYRMSDADYHSDPVPGGSLSSTFARLLTDHVPAKADAIRRNRKASKAMNLGKAAHARALGAGPELVVYEHDGRTKAGKAERTQWADLIASEAAVCVTEDERDRIEGMADVLRSHPEIRHLLDDECDPEVSAFWQEGGVWCRARYDLLGGSAWDYKTSTDVTAIGFSQAMGKYGYHQQADFYLRGLRALGMTKTADQPFRFICQETLEPYLVQIHTPDEEAMRIAASLNDRAIDLYAAAHKADAWAGYPSLHAEPVGLPAWYFYAHEEQLPNEWSSSPDLENVS